MATSDEIGLQFGETNSQRKAIWEGFKEFYKWVDDMGVFDSIELFGSFLSDETLPSDIDVALDFKIDDLSSKVSPVVFDSELLKQRYRVDVLIKEPSNSAYKTIAPTGFKFTSKSLPIAKHFSPQKQNELSLKFRVPPYDLPHKGTIKIDL